MKHNHTAVNPDDGTNRVQPSHWNESHTLEADENFVTDAQLALIGTLGTTRYGESFDSTDLDGSGDITITHGIGYQYPQTTLVNSSGEKVDGYKATFDDANNITLRILGAGTFSGWRIELLSACEVQRFSDTFDSTDLDGSGDITFTHNRQYQYPQVELVDDNDVRKEGYKITYDSNTQCTLRLLGTGAFTGWRIEIV